MADRDPLFALEVRLAEFRLYYWRIDHPSPLWRWRGQVLIASATAATLLAALALAGGLAGALLAGQSLLGPGLGYGSLAALIAAGLQAACYWARQGKVQRGGLLLLGLLAAGLVGYPLATSFAYWSQVMMASLLVVIALSGAILGARMSLAAALAVALLELILTSLFYRNFPPQLLGSAMWIDFTLGLLVCMVLWPVEPVINRGETLAAQARPGGDADAEWDSLVAYVEQQVRPPQPAIRLFTNSIEDAAGQRLSAESVAALGEMYARIQHLLNTVDELCDLSPTVARSDRRIVEYEPRTLLEGLLLEYSMRASLHGLRVMLEVRPDAPAVVFGSPRSVRRALRRILDRVLLVETREAVKVMACPAGPDRWEIHLTTAAPPVPASDASIVVAQSLLAGMGGTLSVQARSPQGMALTIGLPTRTSVTVPGTLI